MRDIPTGIGACLALATVTSMFAMSTSNAEVIHLYAKQGNLELVSGELESGVNVDLPATSYTTVKGVTPLFVAAQAGQLEVVELLLERGADPNVYFWVQGNSGYAVGSPLHAAAKRGFIEIARALIAAGADPNLHEYFTGPPLHVARTAGQNEMEAFLIEAGAVERVEAPAISHLLPSADVENGRLLAEGCKLCHGDPDPDLIPGQNARNLWGIVGSKAGEKSGSRSSSYLRNSGIVWTPDLLNSYLASPYRFLPGTEKFPGEIEHQPDRIDLISYLQTLGD